MSTTIQAACAAIRDELADVEARAAKLRGALASLTELLGEAPVAKAKPAAEAKPRKGGHRANPGQPPAPGTDRARALELLAVEPMTAAGLAAKLDRKIEVTRVMLRALGLRGLVERLEGGRFRLPGSSPAKPPATSPATSPTTSPPPDRRPEISVPLPASTDVRVVKVDGITSRESRFRCLPLACTLTAGACLDRQAAANGATTGRGRSDNESRIAANKFAICRGCKLGREVQERVDASAGGAS